MPVLQLATCNPSYFFRLGPYWVFCGTRRSGNFRSFIFALVITFVVIKPQRAEEAIHFFCSNTSIKFTTCFPGSWVHRTTTTTELQTVRPHGDNGYKFQKRSFLKQMRSESHASLSITCCNLLSMSFGNAGTVDCKTGL